MSYSHQSFYDVIRDDFYAHPTFEFVQELFEENALNIVISFNQDTTHFVKYPLGRNCSMIMGTTPFGEWIDTISLMLTDYTGKRDEELLEIACYVGMMIMQDLMKPFMY